MYSKDLGQDDPWRGLGKEAYLRWGVGLSAWRLCRSYETVAEQMRELHSTGIESVLTCFLDPQRGLHQVEDDLLPCLKTMGLRVWQRGFSNRTALVTRPQRPKTTRSTALR